MACPICPAAGWIGGWVGGYFGINPPDFAGGRAFSAAITANLLSITIIALKAFFNFSLCNSTTLCLRNVMALGVKTLALAVIYSIGVNYFLKHYVLPQHSRPKKYCSLQESSCCCKQE